MRRHRLRPDRTTTTLMVWIWIAYVVIGLCWLMLLASLASLLEGLLGDHVVTFYSWKLATEVPRFYAWFILAANAFAFTGFSWLVVKIIRLEIVMRRHPPT